jgi:hypothetical protein
MILLPGDADARSFNDDSSPDTRVTSNLKVSVDAQVIPGSSLAWYYDLLLTCGPSSGELKSSVVWEKFRERPNEEQERILKGLSKVRIHIVDPRPYKESADDILRAMMKRHDAPEVLAQWRKEGKPEASFLNQSLTRFTAQRIVDDSSAGRAHSLAYYAADMLIGSVDVESVIDVHSFGPDTKPLLRQATQWAAKSAATFHEAVEIFVGVDAEFEFYRFAPDEFLRKKMKARILDKHAFDKGDAKQIERLENAREKVLDVLQTSEATDPFGVRRPNAAAIRKHVELDSSSSFLVQAADIAAGFASKLLEIGGLVRVATTFEYVTYNGVRLTQADAEREQRARWR